MKAQWPAIVFWIAFSAFLAAGFAYWHSRPSPLPVSAPVSEDQSTISSNRQVAEPVLPAEPAAPVSTPRHHFKPRVLKPLPRHRFQSRSGVCARVPPAAYRASPQTITAYMRQLGYSELQVAQVLACIGK